MKQLSFFLLVIAFVGGLVVAQQFLSTKEKNPNGTPIPGKTLGGNFTLTQGDKAISLSDFSGKVGVMYFGYASCPDVCPMSLAVMGSAMKSLTPDEAAQIQGIFVSVDPERDKGQNLMKYAQYFNPGFVGITGTIQELQQVTRQYGTYYQKVNSESASSYLVDHTSTTYVINRDGSLYKTLPHNTGAKEVAEALRAALAS